MGSKSKKLKRVAGNGGLKCQDKGVGSHLLGSGSQSRCHGTQWVQEGTWGVGSVWVAPSVKLPALYLKVVSSSPVHWALHWASSLL